MAPMFDGLIHLETQIYDEDNMLEGAMLCPIILGADKTTVSVATGHIEYHPLYLSIGNIHNTLRRSHCNSVIPIGFLAIPKCMSALFFQVSMFYLAIVPSRPSVR